MAGRDASTRKIQAADLASKRKPASGIGDEIRVHVLLHMPVGVQVVSLPVTVDVPVLVNGRALESWKDLLYRTAMEDERRRELALFRGLIDG